MYVLAAFPDLPARRALTWLCPGTLANSSTWCVVECAAGIISACLPTLRPLLSLVFSGFRGDSKTGQSTPHTDIVTVGGSGGIPANSNRPKDDAGQFPMTLRPYYGDQTVSEFGLGRTRRVSDSNSTGDEVPLNGITVTKDFEWVERSSEPWKAV